MSMSEREWVGGESVGVRALFCPRVYLSDSFMGVSQGVLERTVHVVIFYVPLKGNGVWYVGKN